MDEVVAVRKTDPPFPGTREQNYRGGARHQPHAYGPNFGFHKADHIEHGVARVRVPAGRINKYPHGIVPHIFEEEELPDGFFRQILVNFSREQYGSGLEHLHKKGIGGIMFPGLFIILFVFFRGTDIFKHIASVHCNLLIYIIENLRKRYKPDTPCIDASEKGLYVSFMETQYVKAGPEDYDEVIDLGNYVFSHAHGSHDFPSELPKLCKREYFMDGIHYMAREGNRFTAVIGAYPLELETPGCAAVRGRGIGMVSVHPYRRTKGIMTALMNRALEDMKKDGMVFSCLGGQRQRYENFGYEPAGAVYKFSVNEDNIRHTLGREWSTRLSLKPVQSGDEALLDHIQALHNAKPARMLRQRERLYDILCSMNAKAFAVTEGERFEGYILCRGEDRCEISEINVHDLSRLPEAIGLYLRQRSGKWENVRVSAGPHEGEKIAALERFAEDFTQKHAYQFVVFDYPRYIEPFLKLRERERKLADGSIVLRIEGDLRLRIAVTRGAASVADITGPRSGSSGAGSEPAAELCLSRREAIRFLFSPLAAETMPAIRNSVFLQSLLPLPLFFETADTI